MGKLFILNNPHSMCRPSLLTEYVDRNSKSLFEGVRVKNRAVHQLNWRYCTIRSDYRIDKEVWVKNHLTFIDTCDFSLAFTHLEG